MKTFRHFTICTLSCLILASSAYAETRYISDQLLVTVRSSKGNQYKVLETLLTSTPVEVLEEDKTHVKVMTSKGTVGYIRSQYLSKALPKSIQIKQLEGEIEALQQELAAQQLKFQAIQNDAGTHKQDPTGCSEQLDRLREELNKANSDRASLLSKSTSFINLTAENEQLIEENNLLNSELLVLREENQNVHRSNMIQWFLAGAGVLFVGWLTGKLSRKKQRRF